MSALDSLVYKYLLANGQTEAAEALKAKNPKVNKSVAKTKTKKDLKVIF
ncbi:hypothetical protein INT48_007605, partial [Thamnidium elegans]